MGGKASIFLVLGFGMIILVIGLNYGNIANSSVQNEVDYYSSTKAYNIAVSGAQVALNQLFLDIDWDAGYSNSSLDDGEFDAAVTKNGDMITLTSIGEYNNVSREVTVKLKPSSYAKFAWYIDNMSSKIFVDGDTVYGPFHSQSTLNIGGSPVFFGKVTTQRGFSPDPSRWASNGFDPEFYAGFSTGVDIPFTTTDYSAQKTVAQEGVDSYGGSSLFMNTDLWLNFNADGTVTYRTGSGSDTSSYSPPVTEALTTFAPTGVIYLGKGNIYMQGTLSGQVSVVTGESSGLGQGNVYAIGDIKYNEASMTYAGGNDYEPTASTDMLGIMTTNNFIIADVPANENDVIIDASIFCNSGGVMAENLNHLEDRGRLYITGGVVAAKEELIVKIENDGTFKGYRKHVVYDERFLLTGPPEFPLTESYEIVSWYE
jgi:hypothetical protein